MCLNRLDLRTGHPSTHLSILRQSVGSAGSDPKPNGEINVHVFEARNTGSGFLGIILVCRFCPTFASGQSAPRMARGTQISQFRSSVLAKAQDRSARRGPVTPADAALKHLAQKANKAHAFGSGVPPSTSPTFLAAMNFNSAGQDTWSVATGDLNGDGSPTLFLRTSAARTTAGAGPSACY